MNEHLELWENDKPCPKVIKYDAFTRKRFAEDPDALETLSQCEKCRLFTCNPMHHRCEAADVHEYDWHIPGVWLRDGHNWNLGVDVPMQPREKNGEIVRLPAPPNGPTDAPEELLCAVHWLPEPGIYIALGESNHVPVLFYDKLSFEAAYCRIFPGRALSWENA